MNILFKKAKCTHENLGAALPPRHSKGITMPKYGRASAKKVERAMHERKEGTLRSGRSGKKVTSRKQAIAIGLSEARRAGGKVPAKKRTKATKRASR